MLYDHLFGFEVKSLLWKLLPLFNLRIVWEWRCYRLLLFENSFRMKMLQAHLVWECKCYRLTLLKNSLRMKLLQANKMLQAHHTENTSCGSDSGTYWVRLAKLKFLVWTASWSFCNGQPPTWSFYHSQPPSCVQMWSFYYGLPPTSDLSKFTFQGRFSAPIFNYPPFQNLPQIRIFQITFVINYCKTHIFSLPLPVWSSSTAWWTSGYASRSASSSTGRSSPAMTRLLHRLFVSKKNYGN